MLIKNFTFYFQEAFAPLQILDYNIFLRVKYALEVAASTLVSLCINYKYLFYFIYFLSVANEIGHKTLQFCAFHRFSIIYYSQYPNSNAKADTLNIQK